MNERERIQRVVFTFGEGAFGGDKALPESITVGIGDDAAVFSAEGEQVVLSVDSQVEGVHFRASWLSWTDVGYRATMAALSDLAAMGARPRAIFCALCLPAAFPDEAFEALTRGQAEAAVEVGARILGGNMSRASEVSLHTTVVGGAPPGPATRTRSCARAGHGLWIAGDLGLSGLGCRALMTSRENVAGIDAALEAFRRPKARIEDGQRAREANVSAMIDVSDGLSLDGARIAEASNVRLVFEREAFLGSGAFAETMRIASLLGEDALAMILGGGEDFALLAAGERRPEGFTRVGRVEAGEGVWLDDAPIAPAGHDHFAQS